MRAGRAIAHSLVPGTGLAGLAMGQSESYAYVALGGGELHKVTITGKANWRKPSRRPWSST